MAKIPFPDLPDLPGVDDIPINIGNIIPSAADLNVTNIISALRSGSILSAYDTLFGLKYGIYKYGKPMLEVDTITEITVDNQSQISDFPVEQGAFRSYNKIALPSSYTLEMLKTNSLLGARKTDVINTLQAMLRPTKWGYGETARDSGDDNSLVNLNDFFGVPILSGDGIEFVDVVTPSKTYTNVQVESFSVTETNEEGNKLVIKVMLKEVMQPLEKNKNNPASADGSFLKNTGKSVSKTFNEATDFIKGKANAAINSVKGLF